MQSMMTVRDQSGGDGQVATEGPAGRGIFVRIIPVGKSAAAVVAGVTGNAAPR